MSPIEGEFIVPKRRYSCFFGTDLEILLRGLSIKSLVIVGALTDVCVHYTAVDAHQWNYHMLVVRECCFGSSIPAHESALNAIEYLQTGAVLSINELFKGLEDNN